MPKNKKEMENNEMPEMNINSDSDIPGDTYLNEDVDVENELQKKDEEIAELKDKYLRQAAEFDNYRRRTAEEKVVLRQTAGADVIGSLLEVLDDMDRAEQNMDKNGEANKGTLLVFDKMRKILAQKGLQVVEAKGKDFDVAQHDAITKINAGPEFSGKVVDELEKGYKLNDRMIRYTKVVVGE